MPDESKVEAALVGLERIQASSARDAHRREGIKARLFGRRPPTRRLGRFIELGRLGRGGMGEVFRAYDETLDRQVAVKLMRTDVAGEEQRLLREARALARLSHPNVVQVYEAGLVEGRLFIAMELIRGITLRQWEGQPRSWKECVDVYAQAGRGLAAAHDEGLVHRDFKPANCILDEEGRVRVLDFGLARESGAVAGIDPPTASGSIEVADPPGSDGDVGNGALGGSITEAGAVVGTRAYMAPEQLLCRPADAKSDQFSFCVALYEAIYGQLPFGSDPIPVLLELAAGQERLPQPPPAGTPVPVWLQRALWRGLLGDPEARWPTMHALLEELGRGRRRSWVRWGSLGAAALGGLLLGIPWWSATLATPSPCQDASRRVEQAWNDARRQRMRDAMLATRLPHAADTVVRAQRQLDAYAREWAQIYTDACEATHRHHLRSIEEFERQRRCLDHGLLALGHDVELFAGADEPLVDHAVELVTQLPSLSRCTDLARLGGDPRAERSPQLEAELETLRGYLQRARSLELTGKYDEGLALVDRLVTQARQLEDDRLRLAALQLQGRLYMGAGRYDQAEASLRGAYVGALEHDLDEIVAEALTGLVYVLGIRRAQTEAALWLGRTAEALAARESMDVRLRARALTAVAQVQTVRGDLAAAHDRYRAALETLEALRGEDTLARGVPLDGLAQVLRRQGDSTAAESMYREALELRERWLGPLHPATAHVRSNRCGVLLALGEPVEAEIECRRALQTLEGVPRPDPEQLAHTQNNLGSALSEQGRRREAAAQLREAIKSAELAYGSSHPFVAKLRLNLGDVLRAIDQAQEAATEYRAVLRILRANEPTSESTKLHAVTLRRLGVVLAQQGQLDEAEASYREALAALERGVGEHHPLEASIRNRLGGLLLERGDEAGAEQLHRQALRLYERDPATQRIGIANTLRALARALIARSREHEARPHLERSLRIYRSGDGDGDGDGDTVPSATLRRIADAQLMLAEVLLRQEERDRAIELAQQARARLPAEDPLHSRAEAWLRAHAPPQPKGESDEPPPR